MGNTGSAGPRRQQGSSSQGVIREIREKKSLAQLDGLSPQLLASVASFLSLHEHVNGLARAFKHADAACKHPLSWPKQWTLDMSRCKGSPDPHWAKRWNFRPRSLAVSPRQFLWPHGWLESVAVNATLLTVRPPDWRDRPLNPNRRIWTVRTLPRIETLRISHDWPFGDLNILSLHSLTELSVRPGLQSAHMSGFRWRHKLPSLRRVTLYADYNSAVDRCGDLTEVSVATCCVGTFE